MEVRDPIESFESEIRVREYLQVLLGRIRWFIVTSVIVATAMAIYTLSSTPMYRAEAKMMVQGEQSRRPAALQMLGNLAGVGSALDVSGFVGASGIETQLEIIRSRKVMGKAKQELGLERAEDMPKVDVSNVRATNVIQIQCEGPNPKVALKLATDICQNYIDDTLERMRASSKQTRELVANELAVAQEELNEAEETLRVFGEQGGLVTSDAGTVRSLLDRERAQHDTATQLRAKVAATRAQIATLREEVARQRPFLVSSRAVNPNPIVEALRADLNKLETERSHLLQRDYTPTSRKVTELDAQISAIKKQIEHSEKQITGAETQVEPIEAGLRQQLEAAKVTLVADEKASAVADQALSELADEVARLPANLQRGVTLRREFDLAQEKYLGLATKYQECLINEQAITPGTVLIEEPWASKTPISPDMQKGLLAAVLLGCLAGLLMVVGVNVYAGNFISLEQVESALRLPVITMVPECTSLKASPAATVGEPSAFGSSFRELSAALLVQQAHDPLGPLMLVSSGASEGKTTIACHLATALAATGKSVILVDGNLHQPRVHEVFGVANSVGLLQCLEGTRPLDNALQSTEQANLRILPSGTLRGPAEHLLVGDAMAVLTDRLAGMADHVILDTSNSLLTAVGWVVSGTCKTALLVVDMKETKRALARQQASALTREGARLVGVVANRGTRGWGSVRHYDYPVRDRA